MVLAAGQILLDSTGRRILDSSGKQILSNGTDDSACCCPCCGMTIGDPDVFVLGCLFSNMSSLSVSVTSTASVAAAGTTKNFIDWLNAYFVANTPLSITWNTHQGNTGNKCDGAYDFGGINSHWAVQIGSVNGFPVWAFQTDSDTDWWTIGFSNSSRPLGSVGPSPFGGALTVLISDHADGTGTCCSANCTNCQFVTDSVTGTMTLTMAVQNNAPCFDCDAFP